MKQAVQIAGYTFIALMVASCAALALAVVMEFAGVSSLIERTLFSRDKRQALHKTGYYGQPLDEDPYDAVTVQHLHPYYLFSLPWRPEDIAAANNAVVTLNANGFRNSGIDDAEADAILLGGSTAFGHKSSSDRHTLAWRLSEATGFRFANRNAPSWNSHQELVAAAKFPYRYRLSLSFTLSNDIRVYCFEGGGGPFIDQPKSFEQLSARVNDIRGEVLAGSADQPALQGWFPDTYRLIARLLADESTAEEKRERRLGKFCSAEPVDATAGAIAEAFLQNQRQIAALAEAKGAQHLVVLQPRRPFYRDGIDTPLFRKVYALVMEDPWCATHCVDFSRIPGVDPAIFYDGTNIAEAHFADQVHLTDKGVDAVVAALAPIVVSVVARAP